MRCSKKGLTTAIDLSPEANDTSALMISIRELAKLLKLSTRHLERMDCVGRIPEPIRFGRTKRWLLSEINAWIAAGCPDRDSWQAMKEVSSDN